MLPSPSCCGIWGFNFKECEKRFTCTPFIIYYLIRTISASVCSSYLLQIINSRQDHNFKIHMGKLIRASLQLRASVDVKLRSTSRVFAPSIFYESTWRKIGTIPLSWARLLFSANTSTYSIYWLLYRSARLPTRCCLADWITSTAIEYIMTPRAYVTTFFGKHYFKSIRRV